MPGKIVGQPSPMKTVRATALPEGLDRLSTENGDKYALPENSL